MGDTKIEWTRNADGTAGKTWNPIRARNKATGKVGWFCEHVSEGCRNCYAERMNSNTYFGNGLDYKPAVLDQVKLFLDEKILQQPLHWRKPTMVFPCSMTDLFGRWVKDEWLDRIFAVMALAKQHTFQCLTKRPDRMLEYVSWLSRSILPLEGVARSMGYTFKFRGLDGKEYSLLPWPIPNVWLGVSCEDQTTADERIPLLLQTPAAVRWISAEPLLGPVSIEKWIATTVVHAGKHIAPETVAALKEMGKAVTRSQGFELIDWVVVGGESGPKARPMHPDWARQLRDQCVAAGVPYFFKQWGEHKPLASVFNRDDEMHLDAAALADESKNIAIDGHGKVYWNDGDGPPVPPEKRDAYVMSRVGKKAAGRLLDGVEWSQFPEAKAKVTAA